MGSASPKESNSRHLAWDSLVERSLASAKANLVKVGHYDSETFLLSDWSARC